MTLLNVDGIAARYGSSQALFDVSLSVAPGEVLALLGRNGMGKTTTVRVICRLMRETAGRVSFDTRDLARVPAHRAARMGLGLVPEGRRCFAPLSVRENLIAAARPGPWDIPEVLDLFPGLDGRLDQRAASLSGGEQQMLAIGRALMTNPRLMLLDEATEGLAPVVRQTIWTALARLKAQTGLALIVIDKSLTELATIADSAVVLERGRSAWSGSFDTLDDTVRDRYLGV